TNTITLTTLKMAGSVFATQKGNNIIKIGNDSSSMPSNMTGDITAEDEGSKNTLETYLTQIRGNITATNNGTNDLKLYGGGVNGIILAQNSGTNTIVLGNETKQTTITGSIQSQESGTNTITLKNATISQGIIANTQGKNTITITSTEESNSSSDIVANADGTNDITFQNAHLTGTILANKGGGNTIADNMDFSKLIGSVIADSGINRLTISNMEVTDTLFAQNSGQNEVKALTTLFKNTNIKAHTSGTNTINITGGKLESTFIEAQDENSSNTITLNNSSSHINIGISNPDTPTNPDDTSSIPNQTAILANGSESTRNTIIDNANGDNVINGGIHALKSGINEITLKKIMMMGNIVAKEYGNNIINFGENATSKLTGNIIADNATNTLTLKQLDFNGSAQALSDNSLNTITLSSGSFKGYLVAISTNEDSKNDITINNATIHLIGTQVKDKNGANIGTGNDAIYTEGEKAKNDIKDNTSNTWTIDGNITAFNGGKNIYDFKNQVNMTGSLSASLINAKNEIIIENNSFIQKGYIKAQGDEVFNTITANSASKIDSMYLEAISQTKEAINTLKMQNTSTMNLVSNPDTGNAILAQNLLASNHISGESTSKHTITGNILADIGTNTITLKLLDITGDLLTTKEGKNLISITSSGDTVSNVVGDIKAYTGTNTLNFGQTKLTSATVIADGKGTYNKIVFDKTSSFSITNQDSTYALYANEEGARNLITQAEENGNLSGTTTGNISGNVIARKNGLNTISKIESLKIEQGFVESSNKNSKNEIVLKRLTLDLIKSNADNAILANGSGATNLLKGEDLYTNQDVSKIEGNIRANNGGINDIALYALNMNGNVIAQKSGVNLIVLGEEGVKTQSSIIGSIFANEVASKNTMTLHSNTLVTLDKSTQGDNAILASGENAENSIVGTTQEDSIIKSNISALDGGKNTLELENMSIKGSIFASNAGKNNFVFKNSKELIFDTVQASGISALNTLVSNAVGTLSGILVANNSGENDFRITLKSPDTSPTLNIITEEFSKNTVILQGTTTAKSQILYNGGNTVAIFSGSSSVTNQAQTDIKDEDYKNGIKLTLDSNRANSILKDFRNIQGLQNNLTSIEMLDPNTISISGVYIGRIDFLAPQTATRSNDSIQIQIKENSALISRINIKSENTDARKTNISLDQGGKWIATPNNISKIAINQLSAKASKININESSLSTLAQNNTIVDIATGGYASKYSITKDVFTDLMINNASNLNNTIFRIYSDPINQQSDKITIINAEEQTNSAILQVYYTNYSLQNSSKYNKQVLVATVDTNAKEKFSFDISKPTTVEQGYTLVTTEFEKKTEKKNSTSNNEVDNYYIKSYNKSLTSEAKNNSYSILGVNYLVFLANTNNINKRLGEKRDEDYSDSFWFRSYGGQITQNLGSKVVNNYVSIQGGYDYGFGNEVSMHFIGGALGYGYNFLNSNLWKMQSQILSGALYYSYIRNSGIYTDTIFKYDAISTKPQAQDLYNNINNSAFSLTQELGYRLYFGQKKNMFMEFQTEAIVGYLLGFKALQSLNNETLSSSVNDFLAFRGRVGSAFAYRLKTAGTQTDFRIGISYIGDYNTAKFELDSNGTKDSLTMGYNQMISASLGINSYITKKMRIYMEGEMAFMGKSINQNYSANFGIRYSFGTTKKEDIDSDLKQEEVNDFYKLNIEASKIKCNGCNPESGFYIQLVELPKANTSLNEYLNKFQYRIYTQENKATYYVGPYENLEEAKKQQDFINKIKQSLTKNPNAITEIYKINNKSKN
uniref:hypothetical protein n=1 Tax=unclassified Helicobacter TaxID=2593540 RepID=UPI001315140C